MLLFIRHNKKGRAKMARFLYSAFSDEAADSIDGQIAACKANGVTHMELRGVDGKNISGMKPDDVRKNVLGTEIAYIPRHEGLFHRLLLWKDRDNRRF